MEAKGRSAKLVRLIFFINNKKQLVYLIGLCLLAASGMALYIWGTSRYGIGITSDSVIYVWSARNLAQGIGLGTLDGDSQFVPTTVEPPLYPIILSVFERMGIDAFVAARWIGVVCFALIILLFGLLLYRLMVPSFWFPLIGVFLLFFMADTGTTTLYAMTEPLYLVFTLAGLLCLESYSYRMSKRWIIVASILFGLAFLMRYVGITAILSGCLFILIQRNEGLKKKFRNAFLFGCIAAFPMFVWIGRNLILAKTATNYDIRFIPISTQEWTVFFQTILAWIRPIIEYNHLGTAVIVVFAMPIIIAVLKYGKPSNLGNSRLPTLLAIYAPCYLAFIIFSRWMAYPLITFYQIRLLYPFLTILFSLALRVLYAIYLQVKARFSIFASIGLTVVYLVIACGYVFFDKSNVRPYIEPLLVSRYNGLGLANHGYFTSEFPEQIQHLADDAKIFTNDVERFYFFTGKPSFFIGAEDNLSLARLRDNMARQPVTVILFGQSTLPQVFESRFPELVAEFESGDGSIYIVR